MLNRKRIVIGVLLCIVTLACVFWVFQAKNPNVHPETRKPAEGPTSLPPPPDSDIRKEAQGYFEKLYALSGTLTPEEKKVYLESTFALDKLFNSLQGPLLPQAEYERFTAHLEGLLLENPDIGLQAHAPTESHEEVYERQKARQEEIENVRAAIEDVKASEDMLPSAKEALLSILEHRLYGLQDHGAESREMFKALLEFRKTDPDIVGLSKNEDGTYTKNYANMLTLYKDRIHQPDGSVQEIYTGSKGGAEDPNLYQEIQAYIELLENMPPWETPPPPPEHEKLRFSIEYKDVYVDAEGNQTRAEPAETSVETLPELPQEYPEPMITEEEVNSLKESLTEFKTSDPSEWEDIEKFFQDAMGIPLDRFLEMTDAEIEAELNRNLSPSDRDLVSSETDTSLGLPSDESFKSGLRQRFSPERSSQAIQMLSRYGPKEGLRRLKAADPEVGKHVEGLLQKQGAE